MRTLAILLILTVTGSAAEPVIKAGFAERDITPELGMEQPGNYGKVFHKKFHDACKVRAAVFDDGEHAVALVGVDVLAIHRPSILAAKKAIAKATGLSEDAILIAASHSHSAGPAGMILPGEYDHGSELVKKLAYEHSTLANPKYLAKLETELAAAVTEAWTRRAPCTAGVGRGKAEGVTYNRRFLMRDGTTATHPGQGNPDIVEPAGPVDPEVGVIGVWADGKLTGCVVNFACHATTTPGGTSADYVYYLEKIIRGFYGEQVIVVFLNGASGDVTQVDNRNPYKHPTGEEWAQRVGGRVGAEALKALTMMDRGVLAPVLVKTERLKLDRRVPNAEKVKRAYEIASQPPVNTAEWLFAKETVLIDALIKASPSVEAEVMAVQVGPVLILSTPAEYFCQYGLEQKAKSAFPFTFPVSLANGCVGYVPTEEAFGPHGGGYETRLTSHSNLVITAGATFRDTGLKLASNWKPGTLPIAAKPAPFSKAWTYGNNRPEKE